MLALCDTLLLRKLNNNIQIDVRLTEDIQAALSFAQTYNVPLVIKNTGHDYKGRSSAPSSLALWLHNLKDVGHPLFYSLIKFINAQVIR